MMDESNKAAGDTLEATMVDKKELDDSSAQQLKQPHLRPLTLKRHLLMIYGRRTMVQVNRYFRSVSDLATYASNVAFLLRCRAFGIVPWKYRIECRDIKYTHHVTDILDECSYRLTLADLDYNRLRKAQVSRLLGRLHKKLEEMVSPDDLGSVVDVAEGEYQNIFEATRDKQRGMFAELLKDYGIDQKKKYDEQE